MKFSLEGEKMKVYKRSAWTLIKGLISAPFAGFVAAIIVSFFANGIYPIIAGAVIFILVCISSIFSENVRFELNDTELRHFRGRKLKGTYKFDRIVVGYHSRSQRGLLGDNDIQLIIRTAETGRETQLDCSPLGAKRFYEMFAILEDKCLNEPERLQTL